MTDLTPSDAALDAVLHRLGGADVRLHKGHQRTSMGWYDARDALRAALPGWASPEMVAEIKSDEWLAGYEIATQGWQRIPEGYVVMSPEMVAVIRQEEREKVIRADEDAIIEDLKAQGWASPEMVADIKAEAALRAIDPERKRYEV